MYNVCHHNKLGYQVSNTQAANFIHFLCHRHVMPYRIKYHTRRGPAIDMLPPIALIIYTKLCSLPKFNPSMCPPYRGNAQRMHDFVHLTCNIHAHTYTNVIYIYNDTLTRYRIPQKHEEAYLHSCTFKRVTNMYV